MANNIDNEQEDIDRVIAEEEQRSHRKLNRQEKEVIIKTRS